MDNKLLWGVIIPAIAIALLVFLSGSGIGYEISESFVDSIDKEKIISDKYTNEKILVKEVTVKNNFFLPRKIELPNTAACLSNNDIDVYGATDLQTVYESGNNPLFRDGFYDDTGVDISPYESKTIKIYLKPTKLFARDGENITDQYSGVSSITWVESDEYIGCWNYEQGDVVREISLN